MPPQQNKYFALEDDPQWKRPDPATAPQPPTPQVDATGLSPTNKYRVLLAPDEAQQTQIRQAWQQTYDTTPDKHADAMRIASASNLPVEVVERDYERLRRQFPVAPLPVNELAHRVPGLGSWLTDPNNAKLIHQGQDELQQMGAFEWALKAPGRAVAQQINRMRYARLRSTQMFRDLTRAEQDEMETYRYQAERDGDGAAGESFFGKAWTGLYRLGVQQGPAAGYGILGAAGGAVVGGTLGSGVPGLGTAAGAWQGARTGAQIGMAYGTVKSAAQLEMVDTYDELLTMKTEDGQTIDPDVAKVAAITVGGLNGAIELVGLEAFLKRIPGLDKLSRGYQKEAMKVALRNPTVRAALTKIAKSYAGHLGSEVAQEVAQKGISIAGEELAKYGSGEAFDKLRRSPQDAWDELAQTAVQSVPEFALGVGVGPVMGFVRDVRRAKEAEQSVKFFEGLGLGATNIPLATTMPSAFERFVDAATEGQPTKTLYQSADTWIAYWSAKGQNPAEVAAVVTGNPKALEEAQKSGMLVIPTAKYAANLAGTDHNAFFINELRLDPDAMNGREADAFKQVIEATKQQIADEVAAEAETPEAKELADIKRQILERVSNVQGVSRETAGTMVQFLAGFAQLAQRSGVITPKQLYETYGLTFDRRTAPQPTADRTLTQEAKPEGEDVPGLGKLEAEVGEATLEQLNDGALQENASGESAASQEALSRARGMQARGEQFVVYDRAGRRRVLLGPDAVDYRPRPGELYGVESPQGFSMREDRGGRMPTERSRSVLGAQMQALLQGPSPSPVQASPSPVRGEPGAPATDGGRARFAGYQEGGEHVPTQALYAVEGGAFDGMTMSGEQLAENGIPQPPTPPLLDYNAQILAASAPLQQWAGQTVVVDDTGQPLVVFHGTTQSFTTFDSERANVSAEFGKGFYFSNNAEDVSENYAGVTPDVQRRIDERAFQLVEAEKLYDRELSDEDAQTQARAEIVGNEGLTMPVFLKIETPAELGGENETALTFEVVENADGSVTQRGTLTNFVNALREVAASFHDTDVEVPIARMIEIGHGLTLREAIQIVRESQYTEFTTDGEGNVATGEMIRAALERTGYDGIVDRTSDQMFAPERRLGRAGAGLDATTTHYVVFKPDQIKSAVGNRGTFEPSSPNILYQTAIEPSDASKIYFNRLLKLLDGAKRGAGTGKEWKAEILADKKIGVNRDEFAIAKMEYLDDAARYTKAELIAYIKQNQPLAGFVVLGDPANPTAQTEGDEDFTDDDELDEDEVDELAREIYSEMEDEAWDNFDDWDSYTGDATTVEDEIEDEEEVEVQETDEDGNLVFDDDGDPVMTTETQTTTRTVYWPAISGGLHRVRRQGYGQGFRTEWRSGTEVIEDADSYDTDEEAQDAADDHVRDLRSEDWLYERARESFMEDSGVEWSEAEEEARRRLTRERPQGPQTVQLKPQYASESYQLSPGPETGSYREGFITAGNVSMSEHMIPGGAEPVTKREIAVAMFGKPPSKLNAIQKTILDAAETTQKTPSAQLTDQKARLTKEMFPAGEGEKQKAYGELTPGQQVEVRNAEREYWRNLVAQGLYGKNYSELSSAQRDVAKEMGESLRTPTTLEWNWRDGHGNYDFVKNPIARIRWNVRETLGPLLPFDPASVPVLSAEQQAKVERAELADIELDAMRTNAIERKRQSIRDDPAHADISEQALVRYYPMDAHESAWRMFLTPTEKDDYWKWREVRDAGQEIKAEHEKAVAKAHEPKYGPGKRVLFIEEIQPPVADQQKQMPPIFIKQWRDIAFKFMLHYAVEHNFDTIAWVTGQQQADRWSLESKVEKITVHNVTVTEKPRPTGPAKETPADVFSAMTEGKLIAPEDVTPYGWGSIDPDAVEHEVTGFPAYAGPSESTIVEKGVVKWLKVEMSSGTLGIGLNKEGTAVEIYGASEGQREQMENQPLEAFVGIELADQIISHDDPATPLEISGSGLRLGGAGLKTLYEFDFKNSVKDIPAFKRFGGTVGSVSMMAQRKLLVEEADEMSDESLAKQGITRETPESAFLIDRSGKVIQQFSGGTRTQNADAARKFYRDNSEVPSDQPAIFLTPEVANAVAGGQSFLQPGRYRPASAADVEARNTELQAVVQGAMQQAPAGTGLAASVNVTGEVVVSDLRLPTADPRAGMQALNAVLEHADARNMQVAVLDAVAGEPEGPVWQALTGAGFVKNGTTITDASSQGTLIRPSKEARVEQGEKKPGKPPRAALSWNRDRKFNITFFEHADLTSFLHELGHFYLEVMGDVIDKLDALEPGTLTPQQLKLKADYKTLLNFVGVENRNELTDEHHEKIAEGFETYLHTGKAPSLELRSAFATVRSWFVAVYRSLVSVKTPITPEVSKVFDRLLASDEAIAEAEQAGEIAPMWATPEEAKMSPEQFALYRSTVADAHQASTEALDAALMAEVQREQEAGYKARKAEVRADVTNKAHAMPVYKAMAAMRTGKQPNGQALTAGDAVPMRLSKKMLIEQFGKEILSKLPKAIYAKEGGVAAGYVAQQFGFDSGDALLQAVSSAVPMQEFINKETDRRMLEEEPPMMMDGSIIEAAKAATANERREQVLRDELKALARKKREVGPFVAAAESEARRERDYERRWFEAEAKLRIAIAAGRKQVEIDELQRQVSALRATARSGAATIRGAVPSSRVLAEQAQVAIAGTKVRDLNPMLYWSNMRRASKAATEAAARQDFDEAIRQKHRELISMSLYRETVNAKKEVEKRVKAAKQIATPMGLAKLRLAGQTYHDQIAGVLDRFEFAEIAQSVLDRRAAMLKWVQGQEANGQPVDLPDEILEDARRTNYKDLTVEELTNVTDGIKALVHMARFKDRLLKNERARTLNKLADMMDASIRDNKEARPKERRDRTTSIERARTARWAIASHLKLSMMLRELDGFQDGGIMWESIQRPLNDSGGREAVMMHEATQALRAILDEAYPDRIKTTLYAETFIPAIGESLSKMERILFALNAGNTGNRGRVLEAEKWTPEQYQAVLDTLDERDATMVQAIFDLVGSYWEPVALKQERVYGQRPTKVAAAPFTIGTTQMKGGYFPIDYDDRLSAKAQTLQALDVNNLQKAAAFANATTSRNHTRERAKAGDQPVRLDFGVIGEHLQEVIHDLTHHEALIDIGKILAHQKVVKAIMETHGDIMYKAIKAAVKDAAIGSIPSTTGFDKAFTHVNGGTTVVGLAWSVSTPLMQALGFSNATHRLRPRWMAIGMMRALGFGTPRSMTENYQWMIDASPTMKTRALTRDRGLNDLRNQVGVYSGKFAGWMEEILARTTFDLVTRQAIADSYFYFIGKMQQMVDVPTWFGAYEKAMAPGGIAEGDHERAVALADQAVLDTQGGGQMKDLAQVQRGGPAFAMFTRFYTAGSVLFNQSYEIARTTKLTDPFSVGRALADYALIAILPATAGYFITQALKGGDDDDDDDKSVIGKVIGANLSYLAGSMVGFRELSGSFADYYGYEGPAGARVFAAANRAVVQTKQVFSFDAPFFVDVEQFDKAFFKAWGDTGGILFWFPVERARKFIEGSMAVAEGKTNDPRVLWSGYSEE